MAGGICYLSLVAVRSEPSSSSEMVNQLLFGDLFDIIEQNDEWLRVSTHHDAYEGWCNKKQLTLLNDETLEVLKESSIKMVNSVTALLTIPANPPLVLVQGSTLFMLPSGNIAGPDGEYTLNEGEISEPKISNPDDVVEMAASYLKSAYLWGGRSPFGIDCSGLTQIVYKLNGINLKRDASQQALQGKLINLIEETQAGDVAFFDNEDERITHAGILTGRGSIIHASGEVRIDPIDHHGIFDKVSGKYTHKLRLIRRYLVNQVFDS